MQRSSRHRRQRLINWTATLSLAATALLASGHHASAALTTVTFSGTLTTVDPQLAGAFSAGDLFTGSYQFETTTPDILVLDTTAGFYDAIQAFSVSLPGYSATSTNGAIQTLNNGASGVGPADLYVPTVLNSVHNLIGADVGGASLSLLAIFLADPGQTALADDSLPAGAPDLGDFVQTVLRIGFLSPTGAVLDVIGTLDSLVVAGGPGPEIDVPAPDSWLLLVTASIGLALIVGRKASRNTAR